MDSSWLNVLSLALVILLLLFSLGVPIFISFLVINVASVFWLFGTSGFGLFANSIYQTLTKGSLVMVPLFILMGEVLFRSGTVDILIDSINKLLGQRIKGRDYILITVLSTVFGALCGSPVAVAALLGRSILPSMLKRGYNKRLACGAILGGASLAAIIPPSLMVVVIGSMVDVSIASLLFSGVGPGLLLAALIIAYTYLKVIWNPELDPSALDTERRKISLREGILALCKILPFILVIFFVLGLIMLGIATPSESAATGVVGALVAAAIYRKLSWRIFLEATRSTAAIAAIILIIMTSSAMFGQLLSFTGATSGLLKAATELALPANLMFLLMVAAPFFLCMFIDLLAVVFVAVPIYEPLLKVYGFDPLWFWMMFLINITLGSMSPPFGYTLFSLKGAASDISMRDIYVSAWPMVLIFLVGMTIMYFFPSVVTFLPSLF